MNMLFILYSFNVQSTNLHATKFVVKRDEVLSAQEGWLYGSFHVSRPITPDDADGRLLLRNLFRSLGSVLISKSHCPNSVVYEAFVESVEERRVILKLSARCCGDLGLTDNSESTVDVQFHINRLPLCEMHDAIDRLGPQHIRILFPAISSVGLEEKVSLSHLTIQLISALKAVDEAGSKNLKNNVPIKLLSIVCL